MSSLPLMWALRSHNLNSNGVFHGTWWTDFKIYTEQSRAKTSRDFLQDSDSVEVPTRSQKCGKCRLCMMMTQPQTTSQWKGIEGPQLNPNMHRELIGNRDGFVNYWTKNNYLLNGPGKVRYLYRGKKQLGSLQYFINKTLFQVNKRLLGEYLHDLWVEKYS